MGTRLVALRVFCALAVLAFGFAAVAQDIVYKRIGIELDPTNPMQVEAADGHAKVVDPDYGNWGSEHTWNSPPEVIGPEGFSLTISVQGFAKASTLRPGTSFGASGFDVSPMPPEVFADVPAQGSNGASATFTLVPNALVAGSRADIKIGAAFGGGARYIYEAVDRSQAGGGEGEGGNGGDGGGVGGDDNPVLAARVECPSDTIMVSALPSLSCEIVISGWRTSADPVEVVLPAVVDGWGNQVNGLQSVQNGQTNAQDALNWTRPEYRWWLPVFACPSQDHTGANCEDFITTPGVPVNMPIIVRQRGQVDVNIMLVLNTVAHNNNGGVGLTAGGDMRFGNVWRIGEFMNIESGPPALGPIQADWLSALWKVTPTGDGFVRLESRWYPGNFLHAENGPLEVGPINEAWWSAQWVLEPVPGSVFVRIGNRWRQGEYLNVETGVLQLSGIDQPWESAMWWTLP